MCLGPVAQKFLGPVPHQRNNLSNPPCPLGRARGAARLSSRAGERCRCDLLFSSRERADYRFSCLCIMMLVTEPSNSGRKTKPTPSFRSKTPVSGHKLQISILRVPHVLSTQMQQRIRARHTCAHVHTHKRHVSAKTVQHPTQVLRVHC